MAPKPRLLPYGRQSIDETDIDAVVAVLRSDWLTTGPNIEIFEAAIAEKTGAKFAVACSSGTAALHLAYMAAELNHRHSVIVPANTFMATANAARHTGAEVLFSDIEDTSGLMFVEHASRALGAASGPTPKALVPVHFAGQSADPVGLRRFASDNNLLVIEDASHALGTTYKCEGKTFNVGQCQHADMTIFSFHPVKTITTGEGGCITTNDPVLAKKLQQLRNHGISADPADFQETARATDETNERNPWYHEMISLGLNYRASDIHCALGTNQLLRLPQLIAKRIMLIERYRQLLGKLTLPLQLIREVTNCQPAWHLATVLIDFKATRTTRGKLMKALRADGITTQVHYIPVPYQPYYQKRHSHPNLPGAHSYYQKCLSLPLFPAMEIEDVDRVVQKLAAAITG